MSLRLDRLLQVAGLIANPGHGLGSYLQYLGVRSRRQTNLPPCCFCRTQRNLIKNETQIWMIHFRTRVLGYESRSSSRSHSNNGPLELLPAAIAAGEELTS